MGLLRIDGRQAPASLDATLFDIAESIGVRVPTSCVKQGKCRECLVEIESGAKALSAKTPEEQHLPAGFRLSCRARFVGAEDVVCRTMRRGEMRIVDAAEGLPAASSSPSLDPPMEERRARWKSRGVDGPPRGIALDLGTTTVVLALYDLESGRRLATSSFENPQRFGGSEVMARIRYDGEHRGRLLQRVLLGYLGREIEALPCEPETIVEMVVAGNPTMRDLLFGLDVQTIGQLPYRSITEHRVRDGRRATTSLEVSARKLRLPLHPAARVYGLPLVSSHVGADAAALLLATGLAERDEIALAMDIGTNTEVFIGNRERVLAASCPAGPAFEGGGVGYGMPALEGAIERVEIGEDGRVACKVIGGGPAVGICGSGLVDLLAELRRTGRMNAQGRFTGDDPEAFVLDAERGIVFTEADVNELAQAKGANAAGLRLVAATYGVELGEIDRFFLAGGFGRHLDAAAAMRIGLIPAFPEDRVVQVGNAALAGAAAVLCSTAARARLEEAVRRVEHVPLETHPQFFDAFVDGCQFEAFPSDAGAAAASATRKSPSRATGDAS